MFNSIVWEFVFNYFSQNRLQRTKGVSTATPRSRRTGPAKAGNLTIHNFSRILLITATLFFVGGCGDFLGFFIAPLIPPKTIQAELEMTDQNVLIWVDDAYLGKNNHLLRRELTRQLSEHLIDKKAVDKVVDYPQIARFRQESPDYVDMTIQQLGRRFKVDQVLYVYLDKFQFHHEAGKGFYRPKLTGSAKVIDSTTGKRLWPAEQSFRSFSLEGELAQGQGAAFEDKQVKQLCEAATEQIGPFFYKHTVPR